VGANGQAVVRGIAKFYAALRAIESFTQPVETVDCGERRSLSLGGLLDCGCSRFRLGERFGCALVPRSTFGWRVAPREGEAHKQDAGGAQHTPAPNLLLDLTNAHVCPSLIAACI